MNSYENILILHAVESSTAFLFKFQEEFKTYYLSFNSEKESIANAKLILGNLEPKSLIVYLGHGSSIGLYEPDETHEYKKYFLDGTAGNLFFNEHDVFLLSCKSNEFINRIYMTNYSFGFGNIISSEEELKFHNKNSEIQKKLDKDEISQFNSIYVESSIKIVKSIIDDKLKFHEIPKLFRFYINKEINNILLDKTNLNRVELSRMLFELRNQISLVRNLK